MRRRGKASAAPAADDYDRAVTRNHARGFRRSAGRTRG